MRSTWSPPALFLVLLMAVGSIVMWLVIPFALVYGASQLADTSAPTLGPYLLVFIGLPIGMAIMAKLLGYLDQVHQSFTRTGGRDVLGLGVHSTEPDFTVLEVPGGSTVEVFGPSSPYNAHLTHPVAGFLVDDLDEALGEVRAAGAEIVLSVQDGGDRAWMHFRAPDGFVYELVEERGD